MQYKVAYKIEGWGHTYIDADSEQAADEIFDNGHYEPFEETVHRCTELSQIKREDAPPPRPVENFDDDAILDLLF